MVVKEKSREPVILLEGSCSPVVSRVATGCLLVEVCISVCVVQLLHDLVKEQMEQMLKPVIQLGGASSIFNYGRRETIVCDVCY